MVHYHLRYILILTLFWGADGAYGFLLDINPHAFARDEPVPIYVNVLTSIRTHIPYDYYMYLPTCLPKGIALSRASNIGGLLMGDRIKPSPYGDFLVLRNVTCEIMCSGQLNSVIQQRFMRSAIIRRYRINLLMDGLPLAEANGDSKFEIGIPLGYTLNDMYYINNHLHFTITYVVETVPSGSGSNKKRYRILSFVADPFSVDHGAKTSCTYPGEHSQSTPLSASSNNISWSYSVTWIESKEPWSTRWDLYLSVHKEKIHWYAIVNSTLLVVFLTVVVAALLIRVVRRDLRNVNDIEDEFEYMEDIGWKLLARDVFRPPPKGWLLAGLTGSGIQLLGMFFTVVLFASLGFFSPQSRGSLFTALLACFALLGVAGGYVSARFLKLWGLTKWQYVFLTGTIVPGWAFTIFLIINTVVWSQSSSAAVPFPSLASLIAIWFFVSIPLIFLGAVLGFRQGIVSVPLNYNQIPRHIPVQPWYSSMLTIIPAGFPPFAAIFLELHFILGAIWLNRFYYIFGFLFLIGILFVIVTSETAAVFVYYSLCAEDHRWWWRSFMIGSSSGLYVFFYTLYYSTEGNIDLDGIAPHILYVGYMLLLSMLISVSAGSVGFLACFSFIRFIYRAGKAD